mmetsp:Transcript_836/g.1710  ORF Transcript_836/g.1710 Transcript_836/m.1710 type:complete len:199 (-) Transcript_836:136-732(-)|eukprot:2173954-Rhodomonas_salina.1
MATAAQCERLLAIIEEDIVPKTAAAVKEGNKLFGAAILKKSDMSLVCADTNREMEWPLLHGEVSCLRTFNAIPRADRPKEKELFFIATHEPCSLCLSAITWSGFDNFYYLFGYDDTKDAFGIPHDLKILQEVFKCENGDYGRSNEFFTCHHIVKLVDELEDEAAKTKLKATIERLRKTYADMSSVYQTSKSDNGIPLN